MFQVNDKVIAGFGAWMTITKINGVWASCKFGSAGQYAGKFRVSELSFFEV